MGSISKMNETELARFARQIAGRLEELEAENALGSRGQSVVELDQQSIGRLSRMDALQNQAMALAQQNRRNAQTRRLQAALERIETQEFGWCDECGDAIAPKRLELDPAATRCINCASG